MQYIGRAGAFVFLLLLSGCSWVSEFLVVNKSKETAVVRFYSDLLKSQDKNSFPKVYTIERWNGSNPYTGNRISPVWRMEGDSVCYVELPAECALVVCEGHNSDMRSKGQVENFLVRLERLDIVLPNDNNVSCKGSSCQEKAVSFSRARAGIVIE